MIWDDQYYGVLIIVLYVWTRSQDDTYCMEVSNILWLVFNFHVHNSQLEIQIISYKTGERIICIVPCINKSEK